MQGQMAAGLSLNCSPDFYNRSTAVFLQFLLQTYYTGSIYWYFNDL